MQFFAALWALYFVKFLKLVWHYANRYALYRLSRQTLEAIMSNLEIFLGKHIGNLVTHLHCSLLVIVNKIIAIFRLFTHISLLFLRDLENLTILQLTDAPLHRRETAHQTSRNHLVVGFLIRLAYLLRKHASFLICPPSHFAFCNEFRPPVSLAVLDYPPKLSFQLLALFGLLEFAHLRLLVLARIGINVLEDVGVIKGYVPAIHVSVFQP